MGVDQRQGPVVRGHHVRDRTRRAAHREHDAGIDDPCGLRPRRVARLHDPRHLRRIATRLRAARGAGRAVRRRGPGTRGAGRGEVLCLLDGADREHRARASSGRKVCMRPNPLRDPRDRRIPRLAGPCVLVLFGVTGDLSTKKLLPAIYDLANRGLLPPGFSLVGFARRNWENEDFARITHDAVKAHARTPFREEVWQQLSEGIRFVRGEFSDDEAFDNLARTVAELDLARGTGGNYAFYLSVPPNAFPLVVQQLKRSGLSSAPPTESGHQPWRRVVIEKPFGHDLESARQLNAMLDAVFPPYAVFRIDHYLGKETVQNLLAMRFANTLFEPIWNRRYVDHVQITMSEDIGIGGRAGYYDGIGAARDVIQNHLLQLMALTAMEEPLSFAAEG